MAMTVATLMAGTVAAPAAFAGTASAQAYTCSYAETDGYWHAGYYGGNTITPSSTVVTTAGIEAQCLLKKAGFSPGTIDGVFGSKSQAAAKRFQDFINDETHRDLLAVDGIVGRDTWPFLRCCGIGM
ncbi:peptidoglycan-binding protein [Streptomyces sp. NBC_01171]|uniref:peptidoglycan-binding domain-containing protein n=1 Tax=Streptomyces sp. NBC_01171 TaxID=2903757 RepID=UPI0038691017|nr:peptidoglycan-binding protein [Streptomyces sp. NBC_01171]